MKQSTSWPFRLSLLPPPLPLPLHLEVCTTMTTSNEHSLKKRGLKDMLATRAFRANLKKHPWTRTRDRKFDGFSKKIYERLHEGDKRYMKWEPEVQEVVGLYDQVTRGNPCLKSRKLNNRGHTRGYYGDRGPE